MTLEKVLFLFTCVLVTNSQTVSTLFVTTSVLGLPRISLLGQHALKSLLMVNGVSPEFTYNLVSIPEDIPFTLGKFLDASALEKLPELPESNILLHDVSTFLDVHVMHY